MKNLIHFGCSFAVGNGIPKYLIGLDSGKRSRAQRKIDFKERYGVSMEQQTSSGNLIASRLGLRFIRIAENGASNEMVARKLLQTKIEKHFVLIGITSGNRREALTTELSNTHWHTWKMIGPDQPKAYKDFSPFTPWTDQKTTHYKPAIEEDAQTRTATQILYMQSFLKLKNIRYLMFNALYNGFDQPLTNECRRLLDQVDTKHFYNLNGTFDECQHGWCLKKQMVVSDIDDHPNVEGHRAWAELMLPQAKNIWK